MSTKQTEPCLSCRKRKEIYARGLCSSCYQKWRRVMKLIPPHRHEEAEQKLVAEGKLLAVDVGPRPDSNPFVVHLAEFLTKSERAALAEAAAIEAEQSEPAEPVTPPKERGRPKPTGNKRKD